ncbi:MAG: hypothetical protein ACKO9Z_03470 [Planctomycetota bacterium]
MKPIPASRKAHVLGHFRWLAMAVSPMAVFLVMRWWIPSSEGSQSESDILNEPVSITLFAWQAGLALCLAYLATTEFMLRVIIAALPGLVLGVLIAISFGNTGPGFVVSSGLGLLLFFIIYFNLQESAWIGIKCPRCFRRGTLRRKIIKKTLLDSYKTRDENNLEEVHHIYRKTVRLSCSSCGFATDKVSKGTLDFADEFA